jgi:hypothetical protein
MKESPPSVRRLKGAWREDRLGTQVLRIQLRKRVACWANSLKIQDFIRPSYHERGKGLLVYFKPIPKTIHDSFFSSGRGHS